MKKIINLQSGFTLVELLLFMGIFSILLVILLQLFSSILSTHAESQATSSVDQDGSFILSRLTYDIHNSSGVTSPTIGALPNSQLALSNGTTYQLISGNLKLTTIGNPAEQLNGINTTITNITFTTLGNDPTTIPPPSCAPINCKPTVKILFTLTSTIKRDAGVLQTQTFQTTVATR